MGDKRAAFYARLRVFELVYDASYLVITRQTAGMFSRVLLFLEGETI